MSDFHVFRTPELQDAYDLGRREALEEAATLIETKGFRSTSHPPYHSLADDGDPDVVRRIYAKAIRALSSGGRADKKDLTP